MIQSKLGTLGSQPKRPHAWLGFNKIFPKLPMGLGSNVTSSSHNYE